MSRQLIRHCNKPNGKASIVWYYPELEKCEVAEYKENSQGVMVGSVEFSLYGKEIPSHWLKDIKDERN